MKSLLFTGSNGFLGKNVISYLFEMKYDISTLDRHNACIICDLSKEIPSTNSAFDIVIHAAGKAHTVPKNNQEKEQFYNVNFQGTKNLCKAFEKNGIPKSFIFISTVAVYGLDFGENITEKYPLKGITPYALSKIQAEKFLIAWCKKYNVILSIIRPSLVAGPNPPGNLGAMIKGIKSGKYLSISGGKSRKSILMVKDIANLTPSLAVNGGVFNVCDSEQPAFRDIEKIITHQLGKPLPLSIPFKLGKIMAFIGDFLGSYSPINSNKFKKITNSLTFSNEKALKELGWEPLSVLDNFKI